MMYENKTKKLAEAYDKMFQKFGASSILPQFEGSEPRELEALVKWSSSAGIGAKKMHRFRIYTWREGDGEFESTMLRGSFLLHKKVEIERAHESEIFGAKLRGLMSADGEAIILQRLEPLSLDEHPALQERLDELLADKTHEDPTFGTLTYNAPMNHFRGQFKRGDRMVSVELRETGPDRVAAQAEKVNVFLSGGHVEESEAALRAHAKFKGSSNDDSELALSSLYLTQNRLTASFHVRPSSIEYADVTAFWTDGAFARLRVDHIQTMR